MSHALHTLSDVAMMLYGVACWELGKWFMRKKRAEDRAKKAKP